MKGQTQALTAVLVTTVTVGAVSTAYVWGTPLLEKRQSQAELNKVEKEVFELYNDINSVSSSGAGTTSSTSLEISDGRIEVKPEKDVIEIHTTSSSSPYPGETWTLLKGDSLQNLTIGTGSYGIKGEDKPGVVAVKAASGAGSTSITYRIEFRNLLTQTPGDAELRAVDIQATGRKSATGETRLLISNQGKKTDRVGVSTGETFDRTKTVIDVDIK